MKTLILVAFFLSIVSLPWDSQAANGKLVKDSTNAQVQGFGPSTISNYYLTKSTTFPLTYKLAFKVQTDQDTKMYLGDDATNYYTIQAGVSETFVVNATQAVFAITSSAKTSTPNLRILSQ